MKLSDIIFVPIAILVMLLPIILVVGILIFIIKSIKKKTSNNKFYADWNSAIEQHDIEKIQKLISANNEQQNQSALVLAVKKCEKEVVNLIIEKGIDLNFFYQGKSLLDFTDDYDMVEHLRKHGVMNTQELISELNFLGLRYFSEGKDSPNYSKAFVNWKKTAEQGNAEGQYRLAAYYDIVYNDEYNFKIWMEKAAAQGYYEAKKALGIYLASADRPVRDVVKECQKAIELLKEAAENGDKDALCYTGIAYYKTYMLDKAENYLEKAVENGSVKAQQFLDENRREGIL